MNTQFHDTVEDYKALDYTKIHIDNNNIKKNN